ncbi:hypothetical protein G4228_015427 [Cervus hanglu yarkandensis]|nr:hypothetical protein G4228_015427 [Cervus hanglu yarkandensis]
MRWASALPSPDYYERVARLQQGLRDSEKKRLDLERKLYEYHQSDIFRAKLKYIKLKKYLKEICESEKKARIRNQECLKQFERIQADITASLEKVQQLKIEFETQIKKMQLFPKDSLGKKGELKDEDKEKVVMLAEINSGTAMSRGLYQPATIFMGRQMSAFSGIGDFTTEQKSPQPTKNFSIPDPHSHWQTAQSSDVTDSCVVQTPGDTPCLNKSDKIDGKTSLQIGEKTPVTASALSEEEQTHCFEIESNARQGKSNLSESKKSAELHSPLGERLSPENRTTDLKYDSSRRSERSEGEILTLEHIEVEEERARPPVSPLSDSESCASENECPQEKPPAGEASSAPASGLLRTQSGQHIAALKGHDTSVQEEKATALLKKDLAEEHDNRSAVDSSKSSCSLPSTLSDENGMRNGKPTLWPKGVPTREQEDESTHESTEESVAARMPITGLKTGSRTFQTKTNHKIASEASFSSSKGSPLSR